jgi:hypothetical protein
MMVTQTSTNQAAKIQQVKPVTALNCFRHIANESLQCPSEPKNTGYQITAIDLGHSARDKLQSVVGRIVAKRPHHHNIPRLCFAVGSDLEIVSKVQIDSRGSYLVDSNQSYLICPLN